MENENNWVKKSQILTPIDFLNLMQLHYNLMENFFWLTQ